VTIDLSLAPVCSTYDLFTPLNRELAQSMFALGAEIYYTDAITPIPQLVGGDVLFEITYGGFTFWTCNNG
jgi:hypothetical protein